MSQINLLPWREKLRRRQKRHTLLMLTGVAGVAATLVMLAHLLVSARVEAQQVRNRYLEGEVAQVEARISQISDIEKQKQELAQRMDLIGQLQQRRSLPVHLLNELHRVVVVGVQLDRLSLKDETLSLWGYCDSNNQLAEMLRRMETSPWLVQPKVQSIRAGKPGAQPRHSFELTLVINRGVSG